MKKSLGILVLGATILSSTLSADAKLGKLEDVPEMNPIYFIGTGFSTKTINNRDVITISLIYDTNLDRREDARFNYHTSWDIDMFARMILVDYRIDKNLDGDYGDDGEVIRVVTEES